MNTSDLMNQLPGDLLMSDITSVSLAEPGDYSHLWWRELGADAQDNARRVVEHWTAQLPDEFRLLREVIAIRSQVAPVTVTFSDGIQAEALLYAVSEAEADASGTEYVRFSLGLSPVDAAETEASQYFSSLSVAFVQYYTRIHNGLLVDLQHQGGRVPPVRSFEVWTDLTGDDSPEDIEESLVGETDYVPNPTQMLMMWSAGGAAGFYVMDHPLDNWSYEGGSFFDYPRQSRSGRPITPVSIVENFILRALGQQSPSLYE